MPQKRLGWVRKEGAVAAAVAVAAPPLLACMREACRAALGVGACSDTDPLLALTLLLLLLTLLAPPLELAREKPPLLLPGAAPLPPAASTAGMPTLSLRAAALRSSLAAATWDLSVGRHRARASTAARAYSGQSSSR